MSDNLFQDLKDALKSFKEFLSANTAILAPAIKALKPIVPQIGDLLNKLIQLMGELKGAIQNLNVGNIADLDKVSQFTTAVTTVLETAQALLPQQGADIQKVLDAAGVVTGLPSLDEVKQEILSLIDAIVGDLNTLNS
jgi:hypothetical protein